MIVFGEKINTINKDVLNALNKKDESFFRNLALSQVYTGIVDVIDVNVGSDFSVEVENMQWAVPIVEESAGSKVSLAIDSSNPKAIIAGLEKLSNKKGAFINSITLDEDKYKVLLPLAKEYDLKVIALPIDKTGVPRSSIQRVKLAEKLVEIVNSYGISLSKLYIDCIIEPISISDINAITALETLISIKKEIPEVKTFICLSAVSFGLPNRKLVNRNFATLLIERGIDSIILDPLDKDLALSIFITKVLLGKDEYCQKYLEYIRSKI